MATLLKPGGSPRKRGASSSKIDNNNGGKKRRQTESGTTTPASSVQQKENGNLKKKSKKKDETPPTDKTILIKYGVDAKKNQDNRKLGNEEQKERDAIEMVEKSCKGFKIVVSNCMWPYVSEVMLSKDENTVHLIRNEVNHNTISKPLTNEITNNYADNPILADLNGKIHNRSMGDDMTCILTHNTLVSVPVF